MAATRPTRSRISSPFPTTQLRPTSENADPNTEIRAKTLLDAWVEPPIPPQRPSFAEAGIERHGVVANMAPLGTRPSAKVIKSLLRPELAETTGPRTRRREASVASTPTESIMTQTPEPVAISQSRRSASAKTEDLEPPPETPQPPPASRRSLPNDSPASLYNGQGVFSVHQSPIPALLGSAGGRLNAGILVQRPHLPLPPIGPDGEFTVNLDQTDNIIEVAVNEALDRQRWPTAYALRTLYDDHRTDYRIVRMIEAIYGGFATPAQQQEFRTLVAQRKRKGRKDRTGEYYFNGDGSDPLPLPPRPSSSSYMSSANLAHFQAPVFTAPVYRTPYTPINGTTGEDPSGPLSEPRGSVLNQASLPTSPHKEYDHEQHVSKKRRSNNFRASGEVVSADGSVSTHANGTSDATKARASRSNSVSSNSSLSSVDDKAFNSPAKGHQRRSHSGRKHSHRLSQRPSSSHSTGQYSSPYGNGPGTGTPSSSLYGTGIGIGIGIGIGMGGGGAGGAGAAAAGTPGQHVSPYTSANNFRAAAAERLEGAPGAGSPPRPITGGAPRTGPKTFTFSTVAPAAPSAAAPTTGTPAARATPPPPTAPTATTATLPPASSANISPSALAVAHASSSSSSPTTAAASIAAPCPPLNPSMASGPHGAASPPSDSATADPAGATATTTAPPQLGHPPQQVIFRTKGLAKSTPAVTPPLPVTYDADDSSSRLKRKAREVTNRALDASESFVRAPRKNRKVLTPQPQESDAESVAPVRSTRKAPKVRLLTRDAKQRQNNYDSEENSSPTLLSFQPDLVPGSVSTSRAGTPNNFNRPTRKAKTGTGLRVKTSPMKKKGGTLAGIPRASGERNSPSGGMNGPSSNQDDNDEYCSSCGGNGDLVCCDGCTRSFHFKCVDPPMVEGSLPDEWFCNVCVSNRQPRRDDDTSMFGILHSYLDRKNPSAFSLPKAVREYFEGVKTGTEGEYEEAAPPKPKNRGGWDEQPDYFRTKDTKGRTILCHQCGTTASAPDRMIIPCSFCSLYWHMDCLPIPMAKEPGPGRQWRCPGHVDDLLQTLPAILAPAHRFRKIKGVSAVKPALSRGIRNNGHIEIEDTPSDDEQPGFFERREYGHVYRLPEQGIKLDFISKVQSLGGGRTSPHAPRPKPAPSQVWDQRSVNEQQAALNLALLVSQNTEVQNLNVLVNTLLSEAPPAAIALIAKGDAETVAAQETLSRDDRQALLAVKAVIDRKLAAALDPEALLQNGEASLTPQSTPRPKEEEPQDTEMLL